MNHAFFSFVVNVYIFFFCVRIPSVELLFSESMPRGWVMLADDDPVARHIYVSITKLSLSVLNPKNQMCQLCLRGWGGWVDKCWCGTKRAILSWCIISFARLWTYLVWILYFKTKSEGADLKPGQIVFWRWSVAGEMQAYLCAVWRQLGGTVT